MLSTGCGMAERDLFPTVPSPDKFPGVEDNKIPGEVNFGNGNITLNHGRKAVILSIVNTGDRPVQVFSFNLLTCYSLYLWDALLFPFCSSTFIYSYSVSSHPLN
jgi:hypothetical protein